MASKPVAFIGSSVEGLDVANAIAHYLTHDARVTTWTGAFDLSSTTIEDLEQQIANVDFGVVVLSPDDHTEMRSEAYTTPRDNVLLELGMLIGRVGRRRTFFVIPSDRDMHLPTDLLGVTPATYEVEWAAEAGKAREALSAAAGEIRAAIKRLGPIDRRGFEHTRGPDNDSAVKLSATAEPTDLLPPNGIEPGPGNRSSGWTYFAEQGWLTPIPAEELSSMRWVVHRRHGLGEIIGHGPAGGGLEVEVTVRFASGIARLVVPPDLLFDTRRS